MVTLQGRVNGSVSIDCKPGPPTVLLREEEYKVAEYLITMADMGYGANLEMVMHIAYTIAEKTGPKHPFTGESAGSLKVFEDAILNFIKTLKMEK